jgi:multiple sugar transport system permease protein
MSEVIKTERINNSVTSKSKLWMFLRKKKNPQKGSLVYRLMVYILLFGVAYVFIFPFLYMIVTSLKSPVDLADFTINWVPSTLHWTNYKLAAEVLDYPIHFRNSILITAFSVFGHIVSCSFIGYGFARYQFPGKKILFGLVILSIIVPIQTLIVPMYIMYSNLEWVDSFLPLILPTFFGFGLRGGLYIFIFRQFFLGLPRELEEAAKIDGCNFFRIFWNIVLPISRPAILVSAVLGMVWHWNDYFEPSIYLHSQNMLPLPSVLPSLYEMFEMIENEAELLEEILQFNDAVIMASTFLVVLPVLIIYSVLQRYFVQGVERTGLVG